MAEAPAFVAPSAEAPAPSVAEELAASIATGQTPEITQEPAAEEASIVPPAVVDTPAVADAPTPAVRPATRPESVEIAALPATEPLPEPVATPQPAADQPVSGDVLPTASANRPVEDSEIASVALPTTPDNIENIGSGPVVEISAVTPGNELPPVVAPVTGSWTVQLPFTAAGEQSNIVAEAGPISPVWVEPGLVIVAVNGVDIDAISDIPEALRQQIGDADVAPTIPVAFNTIKPSTGDFVQYSWVVPVVQNVTLADGTAFQTAFSGTGWTTSVVALDQSEPGGLEVGDVITSYISTGETIDQRDSIMNIFEREFANGTEQFSFAVQRDGGLWVASHTATDAAE